MIYAPMLISTLCRDEKFIRCVESLKRNRYAKYTDMYIALDYPAKEEHWSGHQKICDYLLGDFSDFASFTVIRRETNFGSRRNNQEARAYIFKNHDCFIRTDDDCEFAPNFLEYMDRCLTHFKEDPDVIGVTGYSYPVKWNVEKEGNAFKSNLIFPMWGTGFWKNKFLAVSEEIESGRMKEKFLKTSSKKYLTDMTDARYLEYVNGSIAVGSGGGG